MAAARPVSGSGKYRFRVTLECPLAERGSAGGRDIEYVEYSRLWADIEELSGHEAVIAGGEQAVTNVRITLRWSPNLRPMTTEWRLRRNDVIYSINEMLNPDGVQRELVVNCSGLRERKV